MPATTRSQKSSQSLKFQSSRSDFGSDSSVRNDQSVENQTMRIKDWINPTNIPLPQTTNNSSRGGSPSGGQHLNLQQSSNWIQPSLHKEQQGANQTLFNNGSQQPEISEKCSIRRNVLEDNQELGSSSSPEQIQRTGESRQSGGTIQFNICKEKPTSQKEVVQSTQANQERFDLCRDSRYGQRDKQCLQSHRQEDENERAKPGQGCSGRRRSHGGIVNSEQNTNPVYISDKDNLISEIHSNLFSTTSEVNNNISMMDKIINNCSERICELTYEIKKIKNNVSEISSILKSENENKTKNYENLNKNLNDFISKMYTSTNEKIDVENKTIEVIDKIYSSVTKDDNRIKRLENMILENSSQIKRISCKNINEDIKDLKPEQNDRYDRICDAIQRLDNKLDEVNKINCEDYVKELDSKFKLMEFWLNKKLDEKNVKINDISIKTREESIPRSEKQLPISSTPLSCFDKPRLPSQTKLASEITEAETILPKAIPTPKYWPKFSGEGEYNHHKFINWIDTLKEDIKMPDSMITSKLNKLLTGAANLWYQAVRKHSGSQNWDWWKKEIIKKFDNTLWKRRIERAFDRDRFNSDDIPAASWFLKQRERLISVRPDLSNEEINQKIIEKCSGTLENTVKCRIDLHCDFDILVSTIEEILTLTNMGRRKQYEKKPEDD